MKIETKAAEQLRPLETPKKRKEIHIINEAHQAYKAMQVSTVDNPTLGTKIDIYA